MLRALRSAAVGRSCARTRLWPRPSSQRRGVPPRTSPLPAAPLQSPQRRAMSLFGRSAGSTPTPTPAAAADAPAAAAAAAPTSAATAPGASASAQPAAQAPTPRPAAAAVGAAPFAVADLTGMQTYDSGQHVMPGLSSSQAERLYAMWCATIRTEELRAHPSKRLFVDPVSELLSGDGEDRTSVFNQFTRFIHSGFEQHWFLQFEEHAILSALMMLLRTRFYDDFVLRSIEHLAPSPATGTLFQTAKPRVQIVSFSADFDTRAYRLEFPSRVHTTYFEIGKSDLLTYKHSVLDDAAERARAAGNSARRIGAVKCNARVAFPADPFADVWEDHLLAHGFDRSQPSVWFVDHLLPFVQEREVPLLLSRIRKFVAAPPAAAVAAANATAAISRGSAGGSGSGSGSGDGSGDSAVAPNAPATLALNVTNVALMKMLKSVAPKRHVEPHPFLWGIPRSTNPAAWLLRQLSAGNSGDSALRAVQNIAWHEYGDKALNHGRWPGVPIPRGLPFFQRHFFITAQL